MRGTSKPALQVSTLMLQDSAALMFYPGTHESQVTWSEQASEIVRYLTPSALASHCLASQALQPRPSDSNHLDLEIGLSCHSTTLPAHKSHQPETSPHSVLPWLKIQRTIATSPDLLIPRQITHILHDLLERACLLVVHFQLVCEPTSGLPIKVISFLGCSLTLRVQDLPSGEKWPASRS